MPRVAKELSPIQLKRLPPGIHAVGGVAGLLLVVKETGARNWLLRVAIAGRRRELGLGPFPEVSLAAARAKAADHREAVREGRDPAAERASARAALAVASKPKLTVIEAARRCHSAHSGGFSSEKNAKRWLGTLETHVFPAMGQRSLETITVTDVVGLLTPLWLDQNETASKVRARFEKVFDFAVANKLIAPMDNPCRWKGNLQVLMPKLPKDKRAGGHQPSVPWRLAPSWWAVLKTMPGVAPLALQFLALTAVRSGEVTDAEWSEVDLDAGLWQIPAGRTKTGKAHLIPLSEAALDIVRHVPRMDGSPLVFTAPRGGAFSNMAISAVMRRMQSKAAEAGGEGWLDEVSRRPAVPHGLRSTFRTWAAEAGVDHAIAEMALGHQVGSAVERAYNRSGMVEARRGVMSAWAEYLTAASEGVEGRST